MIIDSVVTCADSAIVVYATRTMIVPEMGIQRFIFALCVMFMVGGIFGFIMGRIEQRQKGLSK